MSRTFKLWFVPLFLGGVAIIIGSDIFAPYVLGGRAAIGQMYW